VDRGEEVIDEGADRNQKPSSLERATSHSVVDQNMMILEESRGLQV